MLSVDSNPQAPPLLAPSSPGGSSESFQFRNPEGRVGVSGKGLLPQFGGNPACIVVVEKELEGGGSEILILKGARTQVQFPWFLCRHENDCSQTSCFKELVRKFCEQLLIASGRSEMTDSQTLKRFIAAYIKNVHIGSVPDPINCDNAWLEVTAIHFRINATFSSVEELEQIFTMKGGIVSWAKVDDIPIIRSSHLAALQA
ncbi:unnamed protein product, partial [Hymenolepis diminuta]